MQKVGHGKSEDYGMIKGQLNNDLQRAVREPEMEVSLPV